MPSFIEDIPNFTQELKNLEAAKDYTGMAELLKRKLKKQPASNL